MPRAIIFPRTISRKAVKGPNICRHGHDMTVTGFYFRTSVTKGKAYTYRCCRLCRIEDVQRANQRAEKRRAA